MVPKASGKGTRPLVVAPVANRIVQRAILDVLQSTAPVQAVLDTTTSFGGIKGRDRRKAISFAHHAIRGDHTHYIRSDIKNFFTEIPRKVVREFLAIQLGDDDLARLFLEATSTNLANLEALGDDAERFPLEDRGDDLERFVAGGVAVGIVETPVA